MVDSRWERVGLWLVGQRRRCEVVRVRWEVVHRRRMEGRRSEERWRQGREPRRRWGEEWWWRRSVGDWDEEERRELVVRVLLGRLSLLFGLRGGKGGG